MPVLGLPTSFSPARENLLLCLGADTELNSPYSAAHPSTTAYFPLYVQSLKQKPSQPYVLEEVVEVLGAAQGRKASVAISDHFPET